MNTQIPIAALTTRLSWAMVKAPTGLSGRYPGAPSHHDGDGQEHGHSRTGTPLSLAPVSSVQPGTSVPTGGAPISRSGYFSSS